MDWSDYQVDIFKETKHNDANLSIQAVAGSGKSTTLFEIANRCTGNVLFLAFNKAIASYAKGKMGSDVDCRTFHSYGFGLIKQEIGWWPKVDNDKVYACLSQRYPYKRKEWNPRKVANRIIKKVRGLGIMTYDIDDLSDFIESTPSCFSFNPKESQKEANWACDNVEEIAAILRLLDQPPKKVAEHNFQTVIDFDDMVRFPCIYNVARRKRVYANTVLVDEAQDMNPYQIHLINQLYSRDVRTICVGDSNQAIYAFRGAYADSMERLANMTDAVELPLSVTYRCRQVIVEFTNEKIKGSEMVYHKEEGTVETITKDKFVEIVKEHNVPIIIGAKNKNLFKAWVLLAKNKIAATLKDRGIIEEIRRVMADFGATEKPTKNGDNIPVKISLPEFREALRQAEAEGYKPNDEGAMEQTLPDSVVDLYSCIQEILEGIETVREFQELLDEMSQDSDHHLHTVHSAKGLEGHTVIVLCDWFNSDQTENMKYVAYTRAEDRLLLVEDWEKEEDVVST